MKLGGKTALITGGNGGIGLATARRFVAEGATVIITGRNQGTLDAAAEELGEQAIAIRFSHRTSPPTSMAPRFSSMAG